MEKAPPFSTLRRGYRRLCICSQRAGACGSCGSGRRSYSQAPHRMTKLLNDRQGGLQPTRMVIEHKRPYADHSEVAASSLCEGGRPGSRAAVYPAKPRTRHGLGRYHAFRDGSGSKGHAGCTSTRAIRSACPPVKRPADTSAGYVVLRGVHASARFARPGIAPRFASESTAPSAPVRSS